MFSLKALGVFDALFFFPSEIYKYKSNSIAVKTLQTKSFG
jgi:hypothetical protein